MTLPLWVRLSALVTIGLGAGACDSLDVKETQFGILFVPAVQVEGGGFAADPSAMFFQASGVGLSSTLVGAEGCIVQAIQPPGTNSFRRIDAGEAVAVNLAGTDALLTPYAVGTDITYQLPDGESIPFTPGDQITFSIPGAAGGFPARVVTVRTVEAFTPGGITVPASTTSDMTVTWSPPSETPGTAMFYSFQFSAENSGILDREIACVFADDGSGVVAATMLQGFRASDVRTVIAQRARIVAERIGDAITHVTTTLSVPVQIVGGA